MNKTKRLNYIYVTFEENVMVKEDSNKNPYISVKTKLKNGKEHNIMSSSKHSINLLKNIKAGESKVFFGHFGIENMKGKIENENTFFPIGIPTKREIIVNKLIYN